MLSTCTTMASGRNGASGQKGHGVDGREFRLLAVTLSLSSPPPPFPSLPPSLLPLPQGGALISLIALHWVVVVEI